MLHGVFFFQGLRAAAARLAEDELHWDSASGIVRGNAAVVLLDAARYVRGNAGIQRVVPALQHIEQPGSCFFLFLLRRRHRVQIVTETGRVIKMIYVDGAAL